MAAQWAPSWGAVGVLHQVWAGARAPCKRPQECLDAKQSAPSRGAAWGSYAGPVVGSDPRRCRCRSYPRAGQGPGLAVLPLDHVEVVEGGGLPWGAV